MHFPSSTPAGSLLCCLLLSTVCGVVSAHVCLPVHACVRVTACTCMCVSLCVFACTCMYACAFACACMCMCARACACLCMHVAVRRSEFGICPPFSLIHPSIFFFFKQGLSQSHEFTDSSSLQVSGIYSFPLNSRVTGTASCCHAPLLQGV